MNGQRFLASAIAAASLFSVAAPALAATSDEIIAKQATFDFNVTCADKTDRQRGQCISDILKSVNRLKDEFRDALRKERKDWDKENASLGRGTEYSVALAAYTKTVLEKRKVFDKQQRELEKEFFEEQKNYRVENGGTSRGFSRRVTKEEIQTSTEKCKVNEDDSAMRICLRQQLRLQNPTVRNKPAGLRKNRFTERSSTGSTVGE